MCITWFWVAPIDLGGTSCMSKAVQVLKYSQDQGIGVILGKWYDFQGLLDARG